MDDVLCRICLNTKHLLNLVDSKYDYKKIMEISNVLISVDDELPNFLCNNCKQKIDEFYEFKSLIERSDSFLRSLSVQDLDYLPFNTTSSEIEIGQETVVENDLIIENLKNLDLLHKCSSSKNNKNLKDTEKSSSKPKDNITLNNKTEYYSIPIFVPKSKIQCYICGKLLASNSNLRTHIRTHTGEKPFKCDICKKSVFNLKIHSRIHTGEKPFKCHLCPKKFSHKVSLAIHERKHKGEFNFKCNLCPRSFASSSNLNYHIRIHTGDKKFACSICGRRFLTTSEVKKHQSSHSDERPFVCSICSLGFKRAFTLKTHMLSHNRNKNLKS